MRRVFTLIGIALIWSFMVVEAQKAAGLRLFTAYPARTIPSGETVSLPLTVRNVGLAPQIVRLEVQDLPEGWKATFLGGGQAVQSVYVDTDESVNVNLKLEPPKDLAPGVYRLAVRARSPEGRLQAELLLELTVAEKQPAKLTLEVELPTLRGTSASSFRYRATVKNESDQELLVNLDIEAPEGWRATSRVGFGTEEVTSFPLKAGESKNLDIELRPPKQIAAGEYPTTLRALAGEAQAMVALKSVIIGQPELSVTGIEGRLSGQVYVGQENVLKVIVKNQGSAPARSVELSAFEPSGWKVEFDPKVIAEIAPEQEVEVTAKIKPSERAIVGDYMLTVTARTEGISESAQFRLSVQTSTLWGIVGIALIAVALGVVGLAVARFGRR
ncbi:MAG: NEW3 domain-containing protein [Candidatus Bipolaricaulota bacterium]|nr:NEW3 domain-containing protein [Candidatus Bipolaricaulota bacterium]MCS7274533.1 NEW3 domain-containing protein [Candidatus Bipolaricaulota bacterium]MDW8111222.1 NEW3 domain-containing protein [Candidatus Bipolaricaulota bacterium]MDW8329447.1 NEW3 domain-containing protein [Candidatus Bipolaricaulota bacterium]